MSGSLAKLCLSAFLHRHPPGQQIALGIEESAIFEGSAWATLDEVLVVAIVRQDAELEVAGGADDSLDPLHFGVVDLGNDDLDLLDAVLADRHFLLSAGVHAPSHGRDELVHVDGCVRRLLASDRPRRPGSRRRLGRRPVFNGGPISTIAELASRLNRQRPIFQP